jgi:leucyl-tRNA synthetase
MKKECGKIIVKHFFKNIWKQEEDKSFIEKKEKHLSDRSVDKKRKKYVFPERIGAYDIEDNPDIPIIIKNFVIYTILRTGISTSFKQLPIKCIQNNI